MKNAGLKTGIFHSLNIAYILQTINSTHTINDAHNGTVPINNDRTAHGSMTNDITGSHSIAITKNISMTNIGN